MTERRDRQGQEHPQEEHVEKARRSLDNFAQAVQDVFKMTDHKYTFTGTVVVQDRDQYRVTTCDATANDGTRLRFEGFSARGVGFIGWFGTWGGIGSFGVGAPGELLGDYDFQAINGVLPDDGDINSDAMVFLSWLKGSTVVGTFVAYGGWTSAVADDPVSGNGTWTYLPDES